MGNACNKCLVFWSGEEAHIFEPGKVSFAEDRNKSNVEVLSMRTHDALSGDGTPRTGTSLQNSCQVHTKSCESCKELSRIDIVREADPTGDEHEALQIPNVEESGDVAESLQGVGDTAGSLQGVDDTAGSLQGVGDSAGPSQGAGNTVGSLQGVGDAAESLQEVDDDALEDGSVSNHQTERKLSKAVINCEEIKIDVEIKEEANETEAENISSTSKNDVNTDEDRARQETSNSNINGHVEFSEKLVTIVTKLAMTEITRYLRTHRKEADYTNRLEKIKQIENDKHLLYSSNKFHGYMDEVVKESMQMARDELIDRSIKGLLKLKTAEKEKEHARDSEKKEQSCLETLHNGKTYQHQSANKSKGLSNPSNSKLSTHSAMLSPAQPSLIKNTVGTEDNFLMYDSTQTPDREIVANGEGITGARNTRKMNKVKSHLANQPSKDVIANSKRIGGTAVQMADNNRVETTTRSSDYKHFTYVEDDTGESSVVREVEIFAKVLVTETIKVAISDVCDTNSRRIAKMKSSKQAQMQATPNLLQVSTRSKQCLHKSFDDKAVKNVWAESWTGCSNNDVKDGNLHTETHNKLLRRFEGMAPVQSQEKLELKGFYAYGEEISRVIIVAVLSSPELTVT